MKIFLISHKFLPKWVGGTEIFTYNLASYLQVRNHQVHVITSKDKEMFEDYSKEFQIHRIYFPKIKIFGFIIFLIQILAVVIRIKPDIIQINGFHLTPLGLIFKKLFKIPYVMRGSGSDIYFPSIFNKIILKRIINNSSKVIALTEYMKTKIGYQLKKIQVIPNGIEPSKFKIKKADARKDLGFDENKKIITFVGSLRPVKGVEFLIKAIYLFKKKYGQNDFKVLIIGKGNQKQYLETLAVELDIDYLIEFVGEIPNQMIPIYLAASDIFVLPSLSEGFSIVLIEAMASGLPVIASNTTGINEKIENGKNGFLVESKNPDEIAEKMIKLFEDEKLCKVISINNINKAEKYTWTNVFNKYEELYDEILR